MPYPNQDELMMHDPATGEPKPYPSHAMQWRNWHGDTAWLFNPWTGDRRTAEDVGSDTNGLWILPPDTDPLPTCPAATDERGTWKAGSNCEDWFIEVDDFIHDVRLVITGDFANDEQRRAYAEEIARRLNASGS